MIYTTLFDHNYLAQGISMIRSLILHSHEPPQIHVLALDTETERALAALHLPGVFVTPHPLFIAEYNLQPLIDNRTWQEYCWTCASLYTDFIASAFDWHATYIDADCFFYADPAVIHEEIARAGCSIGIIPHRFNTAYEQRFGGNGRFNVSWITFKGTVGRQCLQRWALQCRDWCYYRQEEGKFADQKYLDEWPTKYAPHVCEISHVGAGLAPWNVANYEIVIGADAPVYVGEVTGPGSPTIYSPLVFYHFHQGLTPKHKIPESAQTLIYKPYKIELEYTRAELSLVRA